MKQAELKSPRISHLSWGHIEVEGRPPFGQARVGSGVALDMENSTGAQNLAKLRKVLADEVANG